MILTDKIEGKRYSIRSEWHEISISDAIELSKIELPEYFKSIYRETDEAKRIQLVKQLTDNDFNKVIPEVQTKVLCLLSNIPDELGNRLEPSTLSYVYNTILAPIHFGIILTAPGSFTNVSEFKYQGQYFLLPQSRVIFGNDIPMYYETAHSFCEAIELARFGVHGYSGLVATMYRPKGELFNAEVAANREVDFRDLSMSIAWSAFNLLNKTIEQIDSQFKWVFGKTSVDGKVKSAFNRSGLNRFGSVAMLYEVSHSGICGNIDKVKDMPLYEFAEVLSYIRSLNKLQVYAR